MAPRRFANQCPLHPAAHSERVLLDILWPTNLDVDDHSAPVAARELQNPRAGQRFPPAAASAAVSRAARAVQVPIRQHPESDRNSRGTATRATHTTPITATNDHPVYGTPARLDSRRRTSFEALYPAFHKGQHPITIDERPRTHTYSLPNFKRRRYGEGTLRTPDFRPSKLVKMFVITRPTSWCGL